MYKLASALLISSVLISNVYADSERANYGNSGQKEETTGFLSGVALGALAGGPPGAIVGGALGALFGEGRHAKKEVGELQVSLVQNRAEIRQLKEESAQIRQMYLLAQEELSVLRSQEPQIMNVSHSLSALASCCDDTSLSLHFRTGSSDIEDQYKDQLTGIAKLAEALPATRLEIVGYADRNGDPARNLELSKQRTNSVKAFFTRAGISNSTITTLAYGETQPITVDQSFESDFFDRRVIVRLRDSETQFLTQSQENK